MEEKKEVPPFSRRIRELRKQRGLFQADVAYSVGVTSNYISKIETNGLTSGYEPSTDMVRKLAKVLEASEDELILLSGRIPDGMKDRILANPEMFRELLLMTNEEIARAMKYGRSYARRT